MPSLPRALSARLHRPARVCEIGYPGATTEKVRRSLTRDYSPDQIRGLLGDNADETVLLVGVNDIENHIGAQAYAREVGRLSALTRRFSRSTTVVEMPAVNLDAQLSTVNNAKKSLYALIYERGMSDRLGSYRKELSEELPGVRVIGFDRFSPGFYRQPNDFLPDGMHLTPAGFERYGDYIASKL